MKMKNHILVKVSDVQYTAQGICEYFWWDIIFEGDEWILYSIWGQRHRHHPFEKLSDVINYLNEG